MFDIYETAGLTEYAITSRYPGDWEPVTEEEYRKAVEQAKMVYTWVEKIIG
ncbi:HEPN domain-containing protein [bacterium]|nr:HEPN domain-containing protein [bacterium]